jgi:hypothetical protein
MPVRMLSLLAQSARRAGRPCGRYSQGAVTVGIPLPGAVMAVRADLLAGIHLALAADSFDADGLYSDQSRFEPGVHPATTKALPIYQGGQLRLELWA